MNRITYIIVCISLLIACNLSAQPYKKGDSVQVKLNGKWVNAAISSESKDVKEGYVVLLPGPVTPARPRGGTLRRFVPADIKPKSGPVSSSASQKTTAEKIPDGLTGSFALYSGVQKAYIGHCIIMGDGTYKVALSSDEAVYANGTYTYHSEKQSLEWTSGLFFSNNWKGEWRYEKGSLNRIRFNSQTYAEKLN